MPGKEMEMNRKKHELEKAIPHHHQMIDFYLSRGLTYAWTTRKIITDQFKKKKLQQQQQATAT